MGARWIQPVPRSQRPRLRRHGRTLTALAGIVAAATLISACGSGSHATSQKSSVLTVGIVPANVPTSLNPAKTLGAANEDVYVLAYEPILHIEANGSYAPALATTWGYVGTGHKEFTFTLRSDAKFSDGTPVDAAAVVKWLEYFQKAGGTFATQLGSVDSITATSANTVDIKLTAPNSAIEWELSQTNGLGYVAAPSAVANPSQLERASFGAGPYVLDAKNTVPNSSYVYVPNQYYYDKSRVHFSKVILKVIANQSSMLQALQSGQIDVATGDYTTAPQAQAAGFQVVSGRTSWEGFHYLTLGAPNNPLNDAAVRQALSYAVDRTKLTSALLGKYGMPTAEWVTTDGFDPQYANHFAYDPGKAKSLLASAGYANGLTVTALDTAGSLQDGTPADNLVQAVAQQLKQVGVTMKITTSTPSQEFPLVFSGKYQMLFSYYGANPTQIYWNLFVNPKAPLNLAHWTGDAQANSAFDQASAATDPSTSLTDMNRRLTDLGYPLVIYSPLSLVFAKKSIDGVAFPNLANGIANGTFPDPTRFVAK